MADISNVSLFGENYQIKDNGSREEINTINQNISGINNTINGLNNKINDVKNRYFVFIGDSYGHMFSGANTRGWIDVIRTIIPANNVIAYNATDGSGFVNGVTYYSILTNLAADLSAEQKNKVTDVVALGGINDKEHPYENVRDAVTNFINKSKELFPNAIVNIGCLGWSNNYYNARNIAFTSWRAYLHSASSSPYARYLDGLEYAAHDYSQISSDGYHLIDTGIDCVARSIYNVLCGSGSIVFLNSVYSDVGTIYPAGLPPATSSVIILSAIYNGMCVIQQTEQFYVQYTSLKPVTNDWFTYLSFTNDRMFAAGAFKENRQCITTVQCVIDSTAGIFTEPAWLSLNSAGNTTEVQLRIQHPGSDLTVNAVLVNAWTLTLPWFLC